MSTLNRRTVLSALTGAAGAGSGLTAGSLIASEAKAARSEIPIDRKLPTVLAPLSERGDQTATLQQVLDEAATRQMAVRIPPGTYRIDGLRLPSGTILRGSAHQTRLVFTGRETALTTRDARDVRICDLILEIDPVGRIGIAASNVTGLMIEAVTIANAHDRAIDLQRTSGTVRNCHIIDTGHIALFANDSQGLDIIGNRIERAGNNGILVWQSEKRFDGTRVMANTIAGIDSKSGGQGQNGNAINVFRAGSVSVTHNRIEKCAYSAIRANSADNVQVTSNTCGQIGEVAIYAEFGFEGAMIADNLIDKAATGIAVTNYDEGGRLAVVQGNLVRNLFRRDFEDVDKRGVGISVEADTSVTGNTIEGAPTAGILVGSGPFMRDCAITGNVIRKSAHGILLTSHAEAGSALIASNLISQATHGGIRAHAHTAPHGKELGNSSTTTERIVITGNLVTRKSQS